jgi:hypothetical protein
MQDDTAVKERMLALYDELFAHDGYGTLRVELRILRRGQKEVILDCGKQYRFVVDYSPGLRRKDPTAHEPAGPAVQVNVN